MDGHGTIIRKTILHKGGTIPQILFHEAYNFLIFAGLNARMPEYG